MKTQSPAQEHYFDIIGPKQEDPTAVEEEAEEEEKRLLRKTQEQTTQELPTGRNRRHLRTPNLPATVTTLHLHATTMRVST